MEVATGSMKMFLQALLWSRVLPGGLTWRPPPRTEDQDHYRNIKLYSDNENLVDQ